LSELDPVELDPELLNYKSSLSQQDFVISMLNNVLEKDTTNPELWYKLGNAYERSQNWKEAAEAYQHAIDRKNEYTQEWYYRLGYIYLQLQNYILACEAFSHTRILQKAYGVPEDKFNKDASFRQVATYTEYYERLAITPKTVLYESFHGASMSCNPYAIFLYLLDASEFQDWKHIWVVNDLEKVDAKFKANKNIIFIKRNSDAYMRYISSTEYLINNNTFPPFFIKKEEQCYLNTWHGTPLKTLGKDNLEGFYEHKNVSRNFLQADFIITPNDHTTKILIDRHQVSGTTRAKILETGYPRIDLTLRGLSRQKAEIEAVLNLDQGKKTILYAPTYRGSSISCQDQINEEKTIELLTALSKTKKYNIVFRGHHLIEHTILNNKFTEIIIPPSHIDTNELLTAIDILVTDYSSIIFDFLSLNKPIVLFAYDYVSYKANRGLYFDLGKIGLRYSNDIEECINSIENVNEWFNESLYKKLQKDFLNFEDGNSTKRVIDAVFNNCTIDVKSMCSIKKKILIYAGAFLSNGITNSLLNLIKTTDHSKIDFTIVIDPESVLANKDRLNNLLLIPDDVRTLAKVGALNLTLEEYYIDKLYSKNSSFISLEFNEILSKVYQREFLRLFGLSNFDLIINFDGYVRFWAKLFAFPKLENAKNVIYLHNDMYGEFKEKFPTQKEIFDVYDYYEKLISVSESTNIVNKKYLLPNYKIEESKFDFANNILNIEHVLDTANERIDSASEKLIIENASPLFINIARLSVEKGHHQLIEAFALLLKKQPSAKLIILGEGPLKSSLYNLIVKSNLTENVFLLGHKSNPYPYLDKADCFVFSSKHEGQGLALIEALILQKPIICTDFPCAHDVLDKGKFGLIVENSTKGLLNGMETFISGKVTTKPFNYKKYQENALEMFYTKVCGLEESDA
jgi:CDP-glycerol glycerophosphotransferase